MKHINDIIEGIHLFLAGQDGACYAWIDTTHMNAWSQAIHRLEGALVRYRETGDYVSYKSEWVQYKTQMEAWIKEFKTVTEKPEEKQKNFLESLDTMMR